MQTRAQIYLVPAVLAGALVLGGGKCAQPAGSACLVGSDCTTGYCCDGACSSSACIVVCDNVGESCTSNSSCCSGLVCNNGSCGTPISCDSPYYDGGIRETCLDGTGAVNATLCPCGPGLTCNTEGACVASSVTCASTGQTCVDSLGNLNPSMCACKTAATCQVDAGAGVSVDTLGTCICNAGCTCNDESCPTDTNGSCDDTHTNGGAGECCVNGCTCNNGTCASPSGSCSDGNECCTCTDAKTCTDSCGNSGSDAPSCFKAKCETADGGGYDTCGQPDTSCD